MLLTDSEIGADDETPTALVPKMNEFPVSNSVYYQKLILTDPAVRGDDDDVELTGRLDVFGEQAGTEGRPGPAVGVLLTFEQSWRQRGLALGELRKSLSLAPGEVTKLALVDWRRETTSRDEASRVQSEVAYERLDDAATLELVQESVATEQRTGHSITLGTASHRESSVHGSFIFVGGSSSSSTSSHLGLAAASRTGRRDVASSAAKDVERSTEQQAQSARSARATQIREVSETEAQSTSTRVVANYNHAHALTMQYYEVLQVYALQTKVVRAERCVFIPMRTFDFTLAELQGVDERFIELLRRVLREVGALALDRVVGAIREVGETGDVSEESIVRHLNQKLEEERAKLPQLMTKLAEAEARLDALTAVDTSDKLRAQVGTPSSVREMTANAAQTMTVAALEERASIERKVSDLNSAISVLADAASDARRAIGVLNENRLELNQQIWMRIEDYDWHRLLATKMYPRAPYEDQPIGGLVDPTPIGYFGNYVAFKWDFPRVARTAKTSSGADRPAADEGGSRSDDPDDVDGEPVVVVRTAEEFQAMFTDDTTTMTQVALPTEGLFAEAVLGRSNGAETIDMTRFWNWQDSPIPILPPSMAPVDSDSRARGVPLAPPIDFAEAVVKLRQVGMLPEGVDDAAAIAALENAIGSSEAEIRAASQAAHTAGEEAFIGAGRASQAVMDMQRNFTNYLVDLANSKAATAATEIGLAAATGGTSAIAKGGLSSIGGLLNQSNKLARAASVGGEVVDGVSRVADGVSAEDGADDE